MIIFDYILGKLRLNTTSGGGGDVSAKTVVVNPATPYYANNNNIVVWDCTAGNKILELPQASISTNYIISVKKTDSTSNTILINGFAAETIDGGATALITTQYESLTLACDGSNWHII